MPPKARLIVSSVCAKASTFFANTPMHRAMLINLPWKPNLTNRAAISTCQLPELSLGFIATLDYPEMVGVNPEMAHEHMAGLNFMHAVAHAWDAGKLFHIDLNDQNYVRFDQDWRFGMQSLKQSFFLVKLLEDVGYAGSHHFDAHAMRTEDYEGVKDFARGCMRSYLIFKEKADQFNIDPAIQALLAEINTLVDSMQSFNAPFSLEMANNLKTYEFDRQEIASRGLQYEKLDQLTNELLLGVRS